MSVAPIYPIRVEGRLEPRLSRWLWLVKWVLVIPHVVVLAVLWMAFVVLSVIAMFAILLNGRYPRSIFDFNVGVLRWSWRVGFYSYSALATDRYPPFSLREEPDYPATLAIAYPDHLSRGLALVKWWLLAIPHYIIIGFFLGGGWLATRNGTGGGLIAALAIIAGFALLFTTRYPRGLFDFLLGLNRWVLRVAAYAGLMTDVYPPFRLDLGGSEPAALPLAPEPGAPAATAAGAPQRMSAGRVAGAVIGSLVCLVGASLVAGGIAAVVVDRTQRDAAGYVMTPSRGFSTAGYAITSDAVHVSVAGPDSLARDFIGNVRIKSDSTRPVFVGIGSHADVDAYLAGVKREVVTSVAYPTRTHESGFTKPKGPPGAQKFWVATAVGRGVQTLDWKVRDGDWVAVVMNPSGRGGVFADLRIGGELKNLGWIGAGILGAGLLLVAAGGAGIWLAFRRQ